MAKKFTIYHPLKVLQGKRERLASGLPLSGSATPTDTGPEQAGPPKLDASGAAEKPKEVKPVRPKLDGVAGVLYDSWDYMCKAQEGLQEIKTLVDEIEKLIRIGNDPKLADKDRKAPNKALQKVKRSLEQYARTKEIKGDLTFSGRLRDKDKHRILQIGEKSDEVFVLRLEAHHLEGLHLDRARIDSLPSAKKSIEFLLKARIIISETEKLFQSKIDNLDSRLRKYEDALKLEQEAAAGGAGAKFTSTGRYEHLKAKQERESNITGETLALLVNLKI